MFRKWLVVVLLGWQFMIFEPSYYSLGFSNSPIVQSKEECDKLREWAIDRLRVQLEGVTGYQSFKADKNNIASWCTYVGPGKSGME